MTGYEPARHQTSVRNVYHCAAIAVSLRWPQVIDKPFIKLSSKKKLFSYNPFSRVCCFCFFSFFFFSTNVHLRLDSSCHLRKKLYFLFYYPFFLPKGGHQQQNYSIIYPGEIQLPSFSLDRLQKLKAMFQLNGPASPWRPLRPRIGSCGFASTHPV